MSFAAQRQTDIPPLLALGCPYCRWRSLYHHSTGRITNTTNKSTKKRLPPDKEWEPRNILLLFFNHILLHYFKSDCVSLFLHNVIVNQLFNNIFCIVKRFVQYTIFNCTVFHSIFANCIKRSDILNFDRVK